jgi:methylenetetrahydrofolate dehydrogenase (NADP+) / methenyltetrahydrofolate cyclohydrolase
MNVVLIGYSNLIGKTLSHLLINKRATVTICHIYTKDVNFHTKNADLVISAAGVENLVK